MEKGSGHFLEEKKMPEELHKVLSRGEGEGVLAVVHRVCTDKTFAVTNCNVVRGESVCRLETGK